MSHRDLKKSYPSSTTRILHPQSPHFVTDDIFDYVAKGKSGGGAFFLDGHRKVHYVLVLTRPQAYYHNVLINKVISKLEDYGLEIEQDLGITIPVVFIKIHISEEVTKEYLDTYDVQPEFLLDFEYKDSNPDQFSVFKTPLENRNVFHELETEALTRNKLKIIICILEKVQYGPEEDMRGIDKLKNRGIFLDHYPLHDGPIQVEYWHNDDLINDRTLLAKYWANFSCWYKMTPLDLIHKYYGSEIAFCMAWCQSYDFAMLLPVSIVGVVVFFFNYIRIRNYPPVDLAELCDAEEMLCGFCHHKTGCKMYKIKDHCNEFKNIRYLENVWNIIFSNFVIIWALIFNKYWQRKEYYLRRRWNLLEVSLQEEIEVRLGYKEKAKRVVEGNRVNFEIDRNRKFIRILFAAILYVCCIGIIVGFIFWKQIIMIAIELFITPFTHFDAGVMIAGCGYTLQAIFTMTYSKIVVGIGAKLTDIIVPKTQGNYDRLILFLTFTLDTSNNYLPLIHTGFLRNMHHNVPTEHGLPIFHTDYCDPCPCLLDVYIQYAVLLIMKTFCEKICVILLPKIKKTVLTYMKENLKKEDMPQYEEEYKLNSTTTYMVNMFLSTKAIQLGLILAFVFSFPLAPLCALIHNTLASKIDANTLVYHTRRPALKKRVYGVGVWNRIIFYLIIVGGVLNITLICFISDVLDRALLAYNHNELTYTRYYIFSIFQPRQAFSNISGDNYCLFRGETNPPHHTDQYEISKFGRQTLLRKSQIIFFFEIIMFVIFVSLDALIHTVPLNVKKNCFIDRTNLDNPFNKKFNKHIDSLFTETPGTTLQVNKSALNRLQIVEDDEESEDESEEEESDEESSLSFDENESLGYKHRNANALGEEYSDDFELEDPFTVEKN